MVLLDEKREIGALYHLEAYPTNIFINSDGTIADIIAGGLDKDTYQRMISKLK